MDRLISEKDVIQVIKEHPVKDVIGWTRQASYTTKDAFIDRIKAIPSAYKGMTNGEVIKAVFPDIPRTLEWHIQNVTDDWWNSPYEPQESEDKE